jgi:hypothetical protein
MALVGSLISFDRPMPHWLVAPRWSPLTSLAGASPLWALEGPR